MLVLPHEGSCKCKVKEVGKEIKRRLKKDEGDFSPHRRHIIRAAVLSNSVKAVQSHSSLFRAFRDSLGPPS